MRYFGGPPLRKAFALISLLLLVPALPVPANAQDQATAQYARSADALILRYTQVIGRIEHPDPGPTLELFGDGRLVVRYPEYMRRAGVHEAVLPEAEVDRLIGSLVSKGVLDFDPQSAREEKRAAAARIREVAAQGKASPVLFAVGDPERTEIEIHLESYSSQQTRGRVASDVTKRISWTGLQSDAKQYRRIKSIRGLAAAERELRRLIDHPGLQRRR